MAKTVVEKLTSPSPDVAVFKITGVLGYHENKVIVKFFGECAKKNIIKLVLDFSDLSSLGGGCARIIREASLSGEILVCIVGASTTVRNFLGSTEETQILYESDQQAALSVIATATPSPAPVKPRDDAIPGGSAKGAATVSERPSPKKTTKEAAESDRDAGDVAVAVEVPLETGTASTREAAPSKAKTPPVPSSDEELEQRLTQYRALFSLNSSLSGIQDKAQVLEAFLLTTIAQVGTESAVFFEKDRDGFKMIAWKGFETAAPESFVIEAGKIEDSSWIGEPTAYAVSEAPLDDGVKQKVEAWGMKFVAPFVIHGQLEAFVFLGHPVRGDIGSGTLDYLVMLINQTAIAYQNSRHVEVESERTLGLVQSLMSMAEEHTLSRGNTEMILNYVHAVAGAISYPSEHINALIYGTVLRDVGMVRVSDLIVKKERKLDEAEWDIIKRHPIEGAEMLRSMHFSEQTCDIVMYHHERFNGRGYPNGIQGAQIPLGARIVSVVESYMVMLQERPTRPALSEEHALTTLKENWGMRYDPDVVEAFVDIVEQEIRSGKKVVYDSSSIFAAKEE